MNRLPALCQIALLIGLEATAVAVPSSDSSASDPAPASSELAPLVPAAAPAPLVEKVAEPAWGSLAAIAMSLRCELSVGRYMSNL